MKLKRLLNHLRQTGEGGFTLAEMLVVLVIVLLLAAMISYVARQIL